MGYNEVEPDGVDLLGVDGWPDIVETCMVILEKVRLLDENAGVTHSAHVAGNEKVPVVGHRKDTAWGEQSDQLVCLYYHLGALKGADSLLQANSDYHSFCCSLTTYRGLRS